MYQLGCLFSSKLKNALSIRICKQWTKCSWFCRAPCAQRITAQVYLGYNCQGWMKLWPMHVMWSASLNFSLIQHREMAWHLATFISRDSQKTEDSFPKTEASMPHWSGRLVSELYLGPGYLSDLQLISSRHRSVPWKKCPLWRVELIYLTCNPPSPVYRAQGGEQHSNNNINNQVNILKLTELK